jgi:hypothetical protein
MSRLFLFRFERAGPVFCVCNEHKIPLEQKTDQRGGISKQAESQPILAILPAVQTDEQPCLFSNCPPQKTVDRTEKTPQVTAFPSQN